MTWLPAKSHFFEFEDDYVSNGMPGLANFTTSLLEPLEAQGRGFSHGHKKVTGVPNCKAARIKDLLQKTDEDLSLFLDHMRTAVLEAASTIQYDAATLPAKQLSVETLPEVFTERQQLQSRMDGGTEVDGITIRPRIEITPAEPQGHVMREQAISEAEQRSERNAYKCVPLTGCHQSMLPGYRSNAAFGRIADFELDDHGLCKATELAHTWRNPQLSDVDADWNDLRF